MRRLLSTTTLTGLALVAGCATLGGGSYVAQPLDTRQYLTYEWGPPDALPTGDARLDNNAIFTDHLTGTIDLGLAAKGLVRAETGTRPDLLIHYHATVERKLLVDEADYGYNTYPPPYGTPRVQQYDEETLVVDFLDGRTHRLLWRGWVEDTLGHLLHDQGRMERHIQAAVAQQITDLPCERN